VKGQLRFEDVKVGEEIPPLKKPITVIKMAMYAAATWDFVRYHYDDKAVRDKGYPAPFADGQMLGAFLAQMVTSWIGEAHTLRKLGFRFCAMAFPGDLLTCRGRVAQKSSNREGGFLKLDLWIENQRGEKIVSPADALISMR
jgi:acyl dehydratase